MRTNRNQFLAQSGEALVLTNELVSVIRQQRHTGTRVVIATQEPTLSPKLIDLANATFVHRFLSPSWYEVLKNHLAGANRQDPGSNNSLFRTIVGLRTGQALLFCPTARMDVDDEAPGGTKWIKPLNDSYINIQIRRRLTADGGKSITATSASESPKTWVDIDVPMHIVEPMTKDDKKGKKKKSGSKTLEKLNELASWSINNADENITHNSQEVADEEVIEIDNEFGGIPQSIIEVVKQHASYMVRKHGWIAFSSSTKKAKKTFLTGLEKKLNMPPGAITGDCDFIHCIAEIADIHTVRVPR